jgi:hypothetical protein
MGACEVDGLTLPRPDWRRWRWRKKGGKERPKRRVGNARMGLFRRGWSGLLETGEECRARAVRAWPDCNARGTPDGGLKWVETREVLDRLAVTPAGDAGRA